MLYLARPSGLSRPSRPCSWQRIAFAALASLAGAACVPAQAQVSSSASAGNLRYTLIDLDPNDGIAPSVDVTLVNPFTLRNSLTVDRPGQPRAEWANEQTVTSPTAIERNLDPAIHTKAAYDGQGVQVEGSLPSAGVTSAEFHELAQPEFAFNITLSPHTGITFLLDASVNVSTGGSRTSPDSGYGTANLMLGYRNPDFTWDTAGGEITGSVGTDRWGSFTPQFQESRTLTATWNNRDGDSAGGFVDYYVIASGNVGVVPVPEPGEWAMLGVGMGLLGWRARRKRVISASAG